MILIAEDSVSFAHPTPALRLCSPRIRAAGGTVLTILFLIRKM